MNYYEVLFYVLIFSGIVSGVAALAWDERKKSALERKLRELNKK